MLSRVGKRLGVGIADQRHDERDHRGAENDFECDAKRSAKVGVELIANERPGKAVVFRSHLPHASGWRRLDGRLAVEFVAERFEASALAATAARFDMPRDVPSARRALPRACSPLTAFWFRV